MWKHESLRNARRKNKIGNAVLLRGRQEKTPMLYV